MEKGKLLELYNLVKDEPKELFELAVAVAMEALGCNRNGVLQLIDKTNEHSGVAFVSIREYNSDESLNTELANSVININAKYENMIAKDALTLASDNAEIMNKALPLVDAWNYSNIDTDGVALPTYKAQVKEQMQLALSEMRAPKKERVVIQYKFNNALVLNFTTQRVCVVGNLMSKSVTQEGVYKVVKSAPKTVAKEIIKKALELKTSKIRNYALDNLGEIKLFGDTIEIGGGQKLVGEIVEVKEKKAKKKA